MKYFLLKCSLIGFLLSGLVSSQSMEIISPSSRVIYHTSNNTNKAHVQLNVELKAASSTPVKFSYTLSSVTHEYDVPCLAPDVFIRNFELSPGDYYFYIVASYQTSNGGWQNLPGGGTLSVKVLYDAPPSAPQNLTISSNPGDQRVRISWNANTEPDISAYEIYRKVNASGWGYLATTSNNFYVDTRWQYDQGSTFDVKYKIIAKDYYDNSSVFSDEVTCHPWPMGKRAAELVSADVPVTYSLSNFPNPFNPSTSISYSLPQGGHVMLKVYDLLGREVAELVNGVKEKGNHSVNFDASNLSSGIYVYRLYINSEVIVRKMLLAK